MILLLNYRKNFSFSTEHKSASVEFLLKIINIFKNNYITFFIYNAKISDNNAECGKVARMLAAFPR
jgi:hypothetical protein